MAFIDELEVHIKAGGGGNGVVRWRHERGRELAGPSGGNGGKGGDIYALASPDLGLLARYRNVKEFVAERGGDGERDSRHGKNGDDLLIEFPVGSLITNKEVGRVVDLTHPGEKVLLLNGGRGGLGNEHFKSSRNTTPKESTTGDKGEEATFTIELQLIADFGLIGLPNAGKSSLLNGLTNAKAKVGSYAFTTLEPNLGGFYGHIIADIPGLIEGASVGKGLGHTFLRHIKRTRVLLHCISCESDDITTVYSTVRDELKKYSGDLVSKKEIILLTKADMVDDERLGVLVKEASKLNKSVYAVTILSDDSVKKLSDAIVKEEGSLQ